MPTAVKIAVMEYERGWGSKIDDWMVCLSVEDANPMPIDVTDKQFKKLKKEKRVWLSHLK